MRFIIHLLSAIVIALAIGFGLSYFALTDGRSFGAYRVGPWAAWPSVGTSDPDPYTRAFMARNGALELGESEGVQFLAETDSTGHQLNRACRYRIEGTTPVASFWTLVAIDARGRDIASKDGPPGLMSSRISRADNGDMAIYVSRTLAPENWLEITGSGPFQLALTLYDTSNLSRVGGYVETLPAIIREGC